MKGKKWWISLVIACGILIAGAVGGYYVVLASVQPENIIDKFEKAVSKRDVDGVLNLLTSADPVLVLDKEHVSDLIEYFDDENRVFEDEIEDLRDQASGIRKRKSQSNILSLVENGQKKLGLFTDYKIAVQPFYFKIQTNQKGAVIRMEKEQILTARSDDYTKVIGPLMPGSYDIEATFDSEYVSSLVTRQKVELPKQHDDVIDLNIEADYIYPYSAYLDAILYVDGKSTGLTIGEIDRFGPVPLDGSMEISARLTTEWGEFESYAVTLSDEQWPELVFDAYGLTVDGTFPDARLYVNGEDSGLTIADTSLFGALGPFAGDETVTLSAVHESPWGEIRTEELSVNVADGYTYLSFTDTPDGMIDEMLMALHEFWPTAYDSVAEYDPSLMVNVSESSRYDLYYALPDPNYYYDTSYELLDATYGFDYAYMGYAEGAYYLTLDVRVHYLEHLYDSWYETTDTVERNQWYTVTMLIEPYDNAWVVSDLYSFDEEWMYSDTYTQEFNHTEVPAAEVQI